MDADKKIKILIVDDEDAIRRSLAEYLEDFEFKVEESSNAEDAISKCQSDTFDAAIVDLRLPGMTGDALIKILHNRYPEMKFMIHTGSCEFKITEELGKIGLGKDNIIIKPVTDLKKLIERIKFITGKEK